LLTGADLRKRGPIRRPTNAKNQNRQSNAVARHCNVTYVPGADFG
jgi:hypothetical protein